MGAPLDVPHGPGLKDSGAVTQVALKGGFEQTPGGDQNDWMESFLFAERICGRGRPKEDAAALQPRLF